MNSIVNIINQYPPYNEIFFTILISSLYINNRVLFYNLEQTFFRRKKWLRLRESQKLSIVEEKKW